MSAVSNRARAVVLSLVAALAFAVVPAAAANATGPGTATITLTSESTIPSFAFGQVTGPEGTSGAFFSNGIATLSDLALGDYTVTVGTSAYDQGGSVSFTLTTEVPDFVGDLVLTPWPAGTASLSGTIVDEDGAPIGGASVSVFTEARPFPTVDTGPDGTYVMPDLIAGDYTLAVFEFSHFSRSTQFTLADGDAAIVDVVLPRRDATISGRLVDQDGDPVGDLSVVAERVGTPGDFANGFAAPDGTYVIAGLGAGDWLLSAGGPGTPYDRSVVEVSVIAGENPLGDFILTARTTGAVFGSVNSGDLEIQMGIADICATLLHPDGSPAADLYQTGFDGGFNFADVAPGTYTAVAVDCDPTRVPPFATQYYNGAATLGAATTFEVSAGQDLFLDPMFLVAGNPKPTHHAHAVPTKDLKHANRGDIDAPDKAKQGTRITIEVGTEYAGEWVSVWLHDPKDRLGGWRLVAADGTVKVRIPADYDVGDHKLAVQDSDDHLIGWTKIKIKH